MISSENMMSLFKRLLFLVIFLSFVTVSCDTVPEPEPEPEEKQAPTLTIAINEFIEAVMNDVYLWYSTVPDIDIRYEFDSKAYFEKLLNSEDKWSWVTDDIKKQEESFAGKETSYGWSLGFGRFSDTQTIFGLVEFVYPNTPADKAGIKRGDLIFEMNGADITENNYMDLLTSTSITFRYGQVIGSSISNVKTASLTALELNLDPVQFTNIIEHGGHKIGYFLYTQFIENYNSSIDAVLQYFIDKQVTDVVLDLRYNPGGYGFVTQYLCSSLAPIEVVNEEKVLIKNLYNDRYQKYFTEKNYSEALVDNFIKTVPVKMGLTKLYIITGQGTASSSEATIIGLRPYMNVRTVGETTYGKYTGSWTLKPEDFYDSPADYKDFENWAVQPIVMKFANSQGFTDFKDGLVADIPVEDDLFSPIPLGDRTEAMLKTTIEEITGVEIIAMKSAKIQRDYTIFDRGFSKFDRNKREMVFDRFDKSMLK
jgi:C-terminal processing protease CtpA/Prc